MSKDKSKLYKSITNRGNFTMIPNELWNQPISMQAKTVYCYLLAQSDSWNPGLRELAEGVSMATKTVSKALEELQSQNMLLISKPKQGLRNHYDFQSADAWGTPSHVEQSQPPEIIKATPIQQKAEDPVHAPEEVVGYEESIPTPIRPISMPAPVAQKSNYKVGDRNEDGTLKYPDVNFYANAANWGK